MLSTKVAGSDHAYGHPSIAAPKRQWQNGVNRMCHRGNGGVKIAGIRSGFGAVLRIVSVAHALGRATLRAREDKVERGILCGTVFWWWHAM